MPSRKRNKGKARKAKAKVEERSTSKSNDAAKPTLSDQRRRDADVNDELLEKLVNIDLKTGTRACCHGFQPPSTFADPLFRFLDEYEAEMTKIVNAGDITVNVYASVFDRLRAKGLSGMWDNETMRDRIKSYLLHTGTNHILKGNSFPAVAVAVAILQVELDGDFGMAVRTATPQSTHGMLLAVREVSGDERQCTKFFHKRIECSCLREKCKEMKATSRRGVCYGCDEHVPLSKLMICANCGVAQYCSVKCQRLDWPRHKQEMCQTVACLRDGKRI